MNPEKKNPNRGTVTERVLRKKIQSAALHHFVYVPMFWNFFRKARSVTVPKMAYISVQHGIFQHILGYHMPHTVYAAYPSAYLMDFNPYVSGLGLTFRVKFISTNEKHSKLHRYINFRPKILTGRPISNFGQNQMASLRICHFKLPS